MKVKITKTFIFNEKDIDLYLDALGYESRDINDIDEAFSDISTEDCAEFGKENYDEMSVEIK